MFSLVLPTGTLESSIVDLFAAADLLLVDDSLDHVRHTMCHTPYIRRVQFLPAEEIPFYVERGLFDIGVTERIWVAESSAKLTHLTVLYDTATIRRVPLVLAVPQETPWQSVRDLPEGIRIASRVPTLASRYLAAHGKNAEVVISRDASVAHIPEIADAFVGIASTGAELQRRGLRILSTILVNEVELSASPAIWIEAPKRTAMLEIAALLRGACEACEKVLIKLVAPVSKLAPIINILSDKSSPSTRVLSCGDMSAVEAVVPRNGANVLIPMLKGAGARRILQVSISTVVD